MAYKKVVEGRSYPLLYSVTMTVGSRKSIGISYDDIPVPIYARPKILIRSREPNNRDDVMLVQYLLRRIYQQGQKADPQFNRATGVAQLKIDGLYGPKTQRAIDQFQSELRRNGHNIATDGCVESERGNSSTASISHTGYTISWLNKYFWLLHPNLAPDIRVDPECPVELKQSLSNGGW